MHCFQLLTPLFCNHVFNDLSDEPFNLVNLYSESTAWVLVHVSISKLNKFKGFQTASRKVVDDDFL